MDALLCLAPVLTVKINRSSAGDTASAVHPLLSGHAPSPYQAAIFEEFARGSGSLIIDAKAGSGKTSTLKNGLPYLPERAHVQMFAFNTSIAAELKSALCELQEQARQPDCWFAGRDFRNVRAGTFHSVCYGALARHLGSAVIETDSGKCRKILKNAVGEEEYEAYSSYATKLVGYAKGEGIGCLVPDTEERWWDLVEHHGLYLDTDNADEVRGVEIARKLLSRSNEHAKRGSLDFDDQLYLVLLWKLRLWQNDVVMVDEAQDTNPVRRAIARLALKPSGRLVAVGDKNQAIYGFTGASADAIDLIAHDFNAKTLPLTVSYRCAKSIVRAAQEWVPEIEPAEGAPEGCVEYGVDLPAGNNLLTPDDAVLCRQTAPLIDLAFKLIAGGTGCRVLGKEIGEGLVNLVKQMKAAGIDRLVDKLEAFRDREVARFTAKGEETRAEAVADRVQCLLTIAGNLPENDRTVPALLRSIAALFERPGGSVLTLSTIHKSKGLEWPTVAILRPDLMPSKAARSDWARDQETNLMYVAATRAKNRLLYLEIK